jgi:hypothetical protein
MRMNTKQGKVKTWLGGSKMAFENPYITLSKTITMWHLANYVVQCAFLKLMVKILINHF